MVWEEGLKVREKAAVKRERGRAVFSCVMVLGRGSWSSRLLSKQELEDASAKRRAKKSVQESEFFSLRHVSSSKWSWPREKQIRKQQLRACLSRLPLDPTSPARTTMIFSRGRAKVCRGEKTCKKGPIRRKSPCL